MPWWAHRASSAEGGSAFSNAAWWGRGWVSALSQVDTLRPALQLWYCGFDREWSHASPPSLTNPLSFQEAQSQPVTPAYRSYLTRPTRQSYKKKKNRNLLHTSPNRSQSSLLSFASAQPVFQALWSLALAQPSVWETFAPHTADSVCTGLCLCKHVRSHLPPHSPLEFLLWQTCKEGLFTRLRVGQLPPRGMQAWASLCVCQIVFIFRAWPFPLGLRIAFCLNMYLRQLKIWCVLKILLLFWRICCLPDKILMPNLV